MKKLRELVSRFGSSFHKQPKDWELEAEVESHRLMHIEDSLRLRMTPEEARRQAVIRLGGVESTKKAYRYQRGLPLLDRTFCRRKKDGNRIAVVGFNCHRDRPGALQATILS